MSALIIVDVQRDFLPRGAMGVEGSDVILPIIAIAMRLPFDAIVATADWHPPGHVSFASSHPGKKVGERIVTPFGEQILWPDHCLQGSEGATFPPTLDVEGIDHIVHKGTDPRVDSYSGFFDNAKVHSTGLERWLRERKITDLYLVGLVTEYCVKATALDGKALGFDTTLIAEGCASLETSSGAEKRALEEMQRHGIEAISLAKTEALLGKR